MINYFAVRNCSSYLIVVYSNTENLIFQNEELQIAVVDKYCGSAVLRGAHVFAAGILCLGSSKFTCLSDLNFKILRCGYSLNGP